ncbi:MAG TPA: IS630 family transposase [Anaerolineae bacterium]|nr:IS630 family transposase [Anaerolineae bacterium]
MPKITPEFEARMMDVLSVYERDYDPEHPVVCLDEKNHQLLSVPRGEKPPMPGKVQRVDYEYKRHGTVNHFVAVEPKAGVRHIRVTKRRTKEDFAFFIRFLVMRAYKSAQKLSIVLDNLNTHTEKAILESLGEDEGRKVLERIEWHFLPTHASWLNMAEIEISILSRQVLVKHVAKIEMLKREVRAYQGRRNIAEAKIHWGFTQEHAQDVFGLHKN